MGARTTSSRDASRRTGGAGGGPTPPPASGSSAFLVGNGASSESGGTFSVRLFPTVATGSTMVPIPAPFAGTIKNIRLRYIVGGGGTDKILYVILNGGGSLTPIAVPNDDGSAQTFVDTTTFVAVAANDLIEFEFDGNLGPGEQATASVIFEIEPAA